MRFIDSLVRTMARKVEGGNRFTSIQNVTFAVFLALWLATPFAARALTVSGTLTVDTVWAISQSPVTLQGNVTLDQDATLTIEPGVQVRMEPAASFTLRQGAVHAVGTVAQPIVVTSASANPAAGDWGEWRFLAGTRGPQTRLEHMRIEYGSGLVVEKSSPRLSHLAIHRHSGPAIRMDLESSPSGQGLSAEGNLYNAIVVTPGTVRTQVSWGLTGIPYLVRQGLVEIGQAPLAIEPSRIEVGGGTTEPMRVVLAYPAPAGGRVVGLSSNSSGVAAATTANVTVPEGAASADFAVRGLSVGNAVLTANSPELGSAQARVSVVQLPSIGFASPFFRIGRGLPYAIKLNLSLPAPAGGVAVRLGVEPSNAFDVPATVLVPEGATEGIFTARSLIVGSVRLTAQAPGHQGASRGFESEVTKLRLELPGLQSPMVAGFDYAGAVHLEHAAPLGGLVVKLTSSNTSVLSLASSEVTVSEGQTFVQQSGLLRALAKGQSEVTLSAASVDDAKFGPFDVRSPTTLKWAVYGQDPAKAWVGRQLLMTSGITITRQRDGVDLQEGAPLQVQLRCQNEAVCSVQSSISIPAWATSVTVPIRGLAVGETMVEAQAVGSTSTFLPVQVVEPVVDWGLSDRHYVSLRRYLSICLSVPQAGWGGSQEVVEDWPVTLLLEEQNPAGTIAAIYDSGENGAVAHQTRIPQGANCSESRYIAAAQRGKYRIRAQSPDRLNAISGVQTVFGDRGLIFKNWNTEGSSLSVVQGFSADMGILPDYQGSWESIPQPLTVRLRCVDGTVCSTPSEIIVPAGSEWGSLAVPVTGIRPGATEIEATVVGDVANYPDAYTAPVVVDERKLGFQFYTETVRIGEVGQAQVCIGGAGHTSYSPTPMTVSITSSAPSMLRLEDDVSEWPSRESCIAMSYRGIASGTAALTITVPGLSPLTQTVEVRP